MPGPASLIQTIGAAAPATQAGAVPGPIRAVLLFVLVLIICAALFASIMLLMIHRRKMRRESEERPRPTPKGPDAWAESARRMKQ